MNSDPAVIWWLRRDLRLDDNPALHAAALRGIVYPVYILDDTAPDPHRTGSASRWWLHHSLASLNRSLDGKLSVFRGQPRTVLRNLALEHHAKDLVLNRCYDAWHIAEDASIVTALRSEGIRVQLFNGSLLWEPHELMKPNGTPYRVFTPFFRNGCLNAPGPHLPIPPPEVIRFADTMPGSLTIDDLGLLPSVPWDVQLEPHWTIGEQGALDRLQKFLEQGLNGYKEGRDFPAKQHVSRLSPSIHFGEISPNRIWHEAKHYGSGQDLDHFLSELGWREFSYNLLLHNPEMPKKNLQQAFDAFPWTDNENLLRRWQKGMTGYPIVDAGMRELWQTGYMHNRIRMITGSFLVKNLLLHWHHGERWFRDCLVDADLANNSAGWQWIAGCGADAAPYFRIFNPVRQGETFDPDGTYTLRFVPELSRLPEKYLFRPWEAPENIRQQAGVTLGKNYPEPIVDLAMSRKRALDAYASIRKNSP